MSEAAERELTAEVIETMAPVHPARIAIDGPNGAAGWPLSDTIGIPENGGGFGQMFAGGSVYSSAAGTFLVSGPLRDAYWARGGSAGSLGWPTAAASCSAGTCSQAFQNGSLTAPAS